MYFTSDNAAPVPREVMAALAAANEGFGRSYGEDDLSLAVTRRIREVFQAPGAEVFLVGTGTAANALALASYCPPWGAVFCHRHAHIHEDECGAPEFFTHGAKLVPLEGANGRIDPEALARAIAGPGGSIHNVQSGMLSLTNVTEAGTVYSVVATRALTTLAKAHDLPVHLDGARFANAVASTGAAPADLTWKSGVDVLSFGGTKNGLLGVEAVVFFDPGRAREFELRRKRGGQLFSKGRYLAAQMLAMLERQRWLDWAAHANAMATRLSRGLVARGVQFAHPVEANILFPYWTQGTSDRLRAAGAVFYDMPAPDGQEGARLVTSWATSQSEVETFLRLFDH